LKTAEQFVYCAVTVGDAGQPNDTPSSVTDTNTQGMY